MSTDKVTEIVQAYDQDEDRFTCSFCKTTIKPEDCKGCPIYVQAFCPDDY